MPKNNHILLIRTRMKNYGVPLPVWFGIDIKNWNRKEKKKKRAASLQWKWEILCPKVVIMQEKGDKIWSKSQFKNKKTKVFTDKES